MRILTLLVLCLLLAAPVSAQDATPEPGFDTLASVEITVSEGGSVTVEQQPDPAPAEVDPAPVSDGQLAAILLTVVLLAILATIGYLGKPLIIAAAQSAPPLLVTALLAALEAIVARLQEVVERTPNTFDDAVLEAVRNELADIRRMIEGKPAALPPAP
jgi:hypothetical protein